MKLIASTLTALILVTVNAWAEAPNETTIDWKLAEEVKKLSRTKT